jgi:hypothetical protein
MGNMVIFTAASGEQSSLAYDEQKHGMFTYFLLKKLQATKGTVNYGELSEYLKNIVGIESVRINGMPQDPKVTVSPDVLNEWESFTF